MPIGVGTPINMTATGDVTTLDCHLLGFYVNSTSSGTTLLKEGGSSGTIIAGAITPAVGWHDYPMRCKGGLHHTEGGTALDITFVIQDGKY